jgi:riboflavin transporter FmnP
MTIVQLYFVLSALQLLHGTEEFLTGWPERSAKLYQWYRRFLPFVPPNGMSLNFHVLLNFGLGILFLAVAWFVTEEQTWALTFARLVAVGQIVHTISIHILGWILFRPYFPGAITSVVMLIAAIALLTAS